jgi:hypothetical protein
MPNYNQFKSFLFGFSQKLISFSIHSVELGQQWLAAGGHLSVNVEEDEVSLSAQKPAANPYLQKELYVALKGLLNETFAY